jgi:hypothetical protein
MMIGKSPQDNDNLLAIPTEAGMGLGGKVAIIGTGTIKFGENFHQSLPDMVVEADAHSGSRQLQAAWRERYEPMIIVQD